MFIWHCEHARFCVEVFFICTIYKFSFICSFRNGMVNGQSNLKVVSYHLKMRPGGRVGKWKGQWPV